MMRKQLSIALACLLSSGLAYADELLMKNGSRLVGTLVSADNDKVVFDTPFAGEITIEMVNIEIVNTENPVTLLMDDGTIYRNRKITTQEDILVLAAGEGEAQEPAVEFDMLDIALVNPDPWRLGDGYKWFGSIDTAVESERGNSDTDDLDLALESIWRSLEDRFTIRGSGEVDQTDGEKTKNNWKLRNKYDRFSKKDPDNYYGVQAAFEYDEFADLDLRTIVGPYIGRQFYEGSFLALQGEVGLVYVDEQFDVAEDDDYMGGNWELRLTSGIIPHTELYVNQDGILNFDETSNVIVNTTVGIGLPLIYGLKIAAEAKYEYDGGAVEGVDDTDTTYNLKLGYAW